MKDLYLIDSSAGGLIVPTLSVQKVSSSTATAVVVTVVAFITSVATVTVVIIGIIVDTGRIVVLGPIGRGRRRIGRCGNIVTRWEGRIGWALRCVLWEIRGLSPSVLCRTYRHIMSVN